LEVFLQELPARDVPAAAVPVYRAALMAFEASLGKALVGFGGYEINRFLMERKRMGASEQELANLTTCCYAYLDWCEAQPAAPVGAVAAPAPPGRPGPTGSRPPGTARRHDDLPPTHPGPSSASKPRPFGADLQRVRRIALALVALGLVVVGGCLADSVHKSHIVRAFSEAVRQEMNGTTDRDAEALKGRLLELAAQHPVQVTPGDVATSIGELTPQRIASLPPSERMTVMEVMQRAAAAGTPGGEPVIQYLEVSVRGDARGVLSRTHFEFEHHVAVEGAMIYYRRSRSEVER
jgi:hypothetical protein